jgi:hypothetical protein
VIHCVVTVELVALVEMEFQSVLLQFSIDFVLKVVGRMTAIKY